MNARATTSNPPPKFAKPFVPPSDSSRSQSFASSPFRASRDPVPPAKRRRLASTPTTSSSFSLSTPRSSSSRPEQPTVPDLHDARTASSMRVLSIWASLAERYNRRIDEDDIVDIRTGEIIKDRGVLNELPKRCNFGDFADKDDDPATINTDLGDEGADNLAEDEDEDDDGEGAEETDASPAPNGLVSSQITRLAPLRPATSSSDADDLRRFLKAEAIRRELDGGDDSSEDEFSMLPPRSTPAKRTMTPARKTPFTARAKPRPLQTPAPDTESEDEFAVMGSDRDDVHYGYRIRRTPSPEVPASMPSPPPPSSSPGPSSSFSLPSSPLLSRTPLNFNRLPQVEERFGSPTPKRQPLSLASRRTLEDSLNEIDIEFPPPQPRAPSVFGGRPSSAFIIDLSLSDADTEDERPRPPAKATTNPKPVASEPRTARKNGSGLISRKPVPFVLIETKRPAPRTPISTPVASGSSSAPVKPDPVTSSQTGAPGDTETSPKKGRPRTRPSKGKPPDHGDSQESKSGGGNEPGLMKDRSQEEGGDVSPNGSNPLRVDETPIKKATRKKARSPSPARSDSSPKAKEKPRPKLKQKGKGSSTRLAPSDDERGFGSEPSPTRRRTPHKPDSGQQAQVMIPESDPKPKSTRKSVPKPKSIRLTRTTAVDEPRSKTPREPPEEFVDSDGRNSPPLPPSPSPAPPIQPRIRRALKRKRIVSSGSSSGGEQGSPKAGPVQRSSPTGTGSQACTMSFDAIDVDRADPEAGGSKPRMRSQSRTRATAEVEPAPTNATPVVTSSNDVRREDDTTNRVNGSYTHHPSPLPLPVGFPSQTHQPFAHYPGHTPFQDHAINFNHGAYPNHGHNQYGHGNYSFFQDPNAQAILAQAVTQLAALMTGGRPPQQIGQTGGMPANMPAVNGFPGSPGWGMAPTWPPSTPTTSRYPYGYDHQQRSFQSPYVTHNQMGSGVGPSTSTPVLFPPSNTFPSSMSLPKPLPIVQETGEAQGGTRRTRSRSRSKRRVTFVSDPRPGSGPGGSGETEDSPPTARNNRRTKDVGREARGKSKASEVDQGSGLDAGDSAEEGSAGVGPSSIASKSRSVVRGRTPGPGRR